MVEPDKNVDRDSRADHFKQQAVVTLNEPGSGGWEACLSDHLAANGPLETLDAGGSAGFLAIVLSRLGHSVIGIDDSPAMIQRAYEMAAQLGQRIEFRILESSDTGFADSSFDAVVCYGQQLGMPDARSAIVEFRRILRKDGLLLAFETSEQSTSQLQTQGFSHCRAFAPETLSSIGSSAKLYCLSARKPAHDDGLVETRQSLLSRHLQLAKRQLQLYQIWFRDKGMTYQEYLVLQLASRHTKGVRPSDIAASLVTSPQTLTHILQGLEDTGLTERNTNPRDRRSSVITITELGSLRLGPIQAGLRDIESAGLADMEVESLSELNSLSIDVLHGLETAFQQPGDPIGD
ncbi:MAG: methyltransferase domain-containing protein [Coriobacteriia bacterium]|nr:methyltransferase domain-containing protein [Coriobacteriia bacterium]